ncbi:DNA-directed RNA polymerase III subunit RPC5 [Trichomonascus vanleenenianus]|uniref:DNA-directed RNA polymerase III subunit C37 n=1 Tax=Trichomonascus vanleenenianus TaxID=2268995 RepID=UPI003ECB9B66
MEEDESLFVSQEDMEKKDAEEKLQQNQQEDVKMVDADSAKPKPKLRFGLSKGTASEKKESDRMEIDAVPKEGSKPADNDETPTRESTAEALDVERFRDEDDVDEEDPVINSFPVFFTKQAANKTHVYQYPTRAHAYPLVDALNSGVLDSRIKPGVDLVEVDIPVMTGNNFYDKDKGDNWQKMDRQTMSGVMTNDRNSDKFNKYMVGVFNKGQLHLTPIKSIVQLRPQFKYIDREIQTEKELSKSAAAKTNTNTGTTAVQMTARAATNMAPQFSGALKMKKKGDDEQFVGIDWHDRDSDESWKASDLLLSGNEEKLKSTTTTQEYFEKLYK